MSLSEIERQGKALLNLIESGIPESSDSIPASILEQHIAIVGKTGSGKTFTAKGIAETLLRNKRRVCVIDPTGVWWGLRSDITGKKPAFPIFVFGGKHADLPLDSHQGAAIAEIIGKTNTSAVLDTRKFSISERTRFYADFGEALLQLNEGPLNLIIDEAHLMMPQGRVSDTHSAKMLNAGNNLISLGRGVGLRVTMISQRPAKLHKDSLTQAETLIALRMIAPQDRSAIEDWIGEWAEPRQGKELLSSLPSLPTGQGWIWAPEIGLLERLTFPRISTYDSSKAPDGASRNIVLASIDLAAIEQRLRSVAVEVQENDPKRLKARIAELEWQVKTAVGIAKLEERIKTIEVEKPVMSEEDYKRFTGGVAELRALLASTVTDIDRVTSGFVLGKNGAEAQFKHLVIKDLQNNAAKSSDNISSFCKTSEKNGEIGKSVLRRMLIALAQNPDGLADSKLGLRADVSVNGGSFDTYLSKARKSGWIEGDRQELKITRAGLDALGPFDPLPTGRALLDHWLAKLGTGGAGRMLSVLANAYPKALDDQELGFRADVSVKGGSFDTYLSRLRGFDLITGKRSELRASEEFFK